MDTMAATLLFDKRIKAAFLPVHSVGHPVDDLDNITAAFTDTGANSWFSGNSVPVLFELNKYMLPGQRAVVLFAACRLALLLFFVHCAGSYEV
jgi:hypothetical protein